MANENEQGPRVYACFVVGAVQRQEFTPSDDRPFPVLGRWRPVPELWESKVGVVRQHAIVRRRQMIRRR